MHMVTPQTPMRLSLVCILVCAAQQSPELRTTGGFCLGAESVCGAHTMFISLRSPRAGQFASRQRASKSDPENAVTATRLRAVHGV